MTVSKITLALSLHGVKDVKDEGANALQSPVNDHPPVLIVLIILIVKLCASFLSHCYVRSLYKP